ncbi:hypothetical protein CWC11_05395 [Pseudoalteromonas sp. S3178]|nr:hypothetical protein CWC11_05395 [Pseudoalteromonas sp. S3178]
MRNRSAILRVVLGALIAPCIYVIVWNLAVLEHSALYKWTVINTLTAYIAFIVLSGMSHLNLARLRATKIGSYCLVMFGVAVSVELLLSLWSLSGYTSLYYAQTHVVDNHEITKAGYLLKIQEMLIYGAILAFARAFFWFVAVYIQYVGRIMSNNRSHGDVFVIEAVSPLQSPTCCGR